LENDSDSYLTIRTFGQTEIKIKGSKFIGQASPCSSEEEAENILAGIRKKYYDATHHCFAYRVGPGITGKFRYSDAGEPSGTAGKPIFDQIEGKGLTNLIIVVTRYYGGTKLGTGGLTHAYSEAAEEAIKSAGIVEEFILEGLSLIVDYHDYNIVERLIHKFGGEIDGRGLTNSAAGGLKEQIPTIDLRLRKSLVDKFKNAAIEATSGRIRFGENA